MKTARLILNLRKEEYNGHFKKHFPEKMFYIENFA